MKILVFGINYAPELTGIGKYTAEMCSWLAERGHEVQVITGLPYYPEWSIDPRYKKKTWVKERIEGVAVQRCPLFVPKQVTPIKRVLHEISFVLGILPVWFRFLVSSKFDLVICISPPFHLAVLPAIYAWLKKSKLIIHVQDLQVDAARDLKMIRNERALGFMFRLEKYLLQRSTLISTISSGMSKKIIDKGIAANKVVIFPNWVDENVIKPVPMDLSLRKELGISENVKIILYSGNLGEKQGLDIIIEVAKNYVDADDILFLIVGSGGGKEKLLKQVETHKLMNVRFHPLIPYEKLSSLLSIAALHLVLQKSSASDLVLPSKLTSILAVGGVPVVTATPGTSLYQIISEFNMGILVEPESVAALQDGIRLGLSIDNSTLKLNARKYSEDHLSKNRILQQFEDKILKL